MIFTHFRFGERNHAGKFLKHTFFPSKRIEKYVYVLGFKFVEDINSSFFLNEHIQLLFVCKIGFHPIIPSHFNLNNNQNQQEEEGVKEKCGLMITLEEVREDFVSILSCSHSTTSDLGEEEEEIELIVTSELLLRRNQLMDLFVNSSSTIVIENEEKKNKKKRKKSEIMRIDEIWLEFVPELDPSITSPISHHQEEEVSKIMNEEDKEEGNGLIGGRAGSHNHDLLSSNFHLFDHPFISKTKPQQETTLEEKQLDIENDQLGEIDEDHHQENEKEEEEEEEEEERELMFPLIHPIPPYIYLYHFSHLIPLPVLSFFLSKYFIFSSYIMLYFINWGRR